MTGDFEAILAEDGRNSLGRTLEVVDTVLADKTRFDELYRCWFSDDEWVRLRVSNAVKRIYKEHPEWVAPYLERFLTETSVIDQPSTKWTMAQLYLWLEAGMSMDQKQRAIKILKHNLTTDDDWIVQNATLETLGTWAKSDAELHRWIMPHLEKASKSDKHSIAGRAKKLIATLS
jgi:hypothetical protein